MRPSGTLRRKRENTMASPSSHPKILVRWFTGILVLFVAMGRPTAKSISALIELQSGEIQRFGFEESGFSPDQHQIIAGALASYDRALGGHGRLARIIRDYHSGKNWQILYDPQWFGANSSIVLSPTVFDCGLSLEAHFSCYGSINETAHSRIVIGHEVGHLLIRAVRDRTHVNWGLTYASRISRNWEANHDPNAPLEEAVTELSLKVMDAGYFFCIASDTIENDPVIIRQIEAWVVEFLAVLHKM